MMEPVEKASSERDAGSEAGRPGWPGQKAYELGRRTLMLCFLAVFCLIAHQKFFTGYVRSKEKLILLMGVAPFVLAGGILCFVGWWRMRAAGAFVAPKVAEEVRRRESQRRRERAEADLLPWQRRR